MLPLLLKLRYSIKDISLQHMVELSDPSAKRLLTFDLVLSLHGKDVGCGFCWSVPSPFLSAARENLITLHDISSSTFHSCSFKKLACSSDIPLCGCRKSHKIIIVII